MKQWYLLLVWMALVRGLSAQLPNDVCQYATPLPQPDNYCSAPGEFTNEGSEADTGLPGSPCLTTYSHTVWFSFVPYEPAALIRVVGTANGGTLSAPDVNVFRGPCDNLVHVGCNADAGNNGVVELIVSNLIIGQVYYIAVDGVQDATGTFQLCVNDFIPPPAPQSDCDQAVLLCDKSSFQVESLIGTGNDHNEIDPNSCIQQEFASSWYKWTCDQSGTLTFTITPNNYDPSKETDDIDFAVYRLPGGLDDCANKELVRCMASGANLGQPYSKWAICNGPTGLSESSTDVSEEPGCNNGSDNFVAALDMQSGESYALVIMNYSQTGQGFSINFGGTGTFLGPKIDLSVDAVAEFECDKTITFTDSAVANVGQIVSWNWNFGAGANPLSATTPGPHDVIYDSFGDKVAALTVESDAGCRVTKIVNFFVEPCCQDFPDLDVSAELTDNLCYGDSSGQILATGILGNPPYQYSLDGMNFAPSPLFAGLPQGNYTVVVQDRKGCVDSVEVTLVDPPKLVVDAGPDTTITLGDSVFISALYSPQIYDVVAQWIGHPDWVRCDTCLSSIFRPFRTTDYVIEVVNENGCVARDTLHFRVNIIRPFYAPNAFSPNGDGINDLFSLYSTGIAVDVDELMVFDRWGDMVYRDTHVPLNNPAAGWDGTFRGKPMNPGVYVWVAKVRYLDDEVVLFSGDVTLVK